MVERIQKHSVAITSALISLGGILGAVQNTMIIAMVAFVAIECFRTVSSPTK